MPSPSPTTRPKTGATRTTSPKDSVQSRGLKILLASVAIPGLFACGVPDIQPNPAAISAAKEQSWAERHRDLVEEKAPYFGNPGERRAVWSPTELSPEALQRIGFDLSKKTLPNDFRVPSILGTHDRPGEDDFNPATRDLITLDFWPKRTDEWEAGAFIPFPSNAFDNEVKILKVAEPGDPSTDCWMLTDTKYGALSVLIIRSYYSETTVDGACIYAAKALEKYLVEFALWLDAHPEFDPPLEAYGPRD